jgi:RND family efflux transporter MFP subunit
MLTVLGASLLLVGQFIPMGWGAPQGSALVIRNSVPIVPNVAGEVIDLTAVADTPLKAGDVLFKIDPVPFQAQVDALKAQLDFEKLRLAQMTQLQSTAAGRTFDVQERQASVDQLTAQLAGAQYNLGQTVVRAPADGYVTNLALRKGARVAAMPQSPVMAFVDTSETLIAAEIAQINARYIQPGQNAEVTFKFLPGHVYAGKVVAVLQAISTGQLQASGLAITPTAIEPGPFVVRIALDDADLARRLPAGATGEAAIFTEHVQPAHVIRKVLLRQIAILNYVNPF